VCVRARVCVCMCVCVCVCVYWWMADWLGDETRKVLNNGTSVLRKAMPVKTDFKKPI
jgi:hypothetical protein